AQHYAASHTSNQDDESTDHREDQSELGLLYLREVRFLVVFGHQLLLRLPIRTNGRVQLTLNVDELLQHLVGGGDRLRVCGVRPLMLNETDELLCEVDVGLFQSAGRHGCTPTCSRSTQSC